MKKVIRLTESDLTKIVKRVISESLEKKIKDVKITNQIKNELGIGDLTGGSYVIKGGINTTGIEIRHPKYNENKKSILIRLGDRSGIPDSGTWSINGHYITFKR